MAFARTDLTSTDWTLIGNNISSITFQCVSANPIYIGLTTDNTTPDSTTVGLIYNRFIGEFKQDLSNLTFEDSPAYVWARGIGGGGSSVIYETP